MNIILTYTHVNGYDTYDWFSSIDAVKEFVMDSKVIRELRECIDCTLAKPISLELLGY